MEDLEQENEQVIGMINIYAGLIVLLHSIVGSDVGGAFLNSWCRAFNKKYSENNKYNCINLMKMISHLFSFKLFYPILLFDLIRKFSSELTEINVELLLTTLKISGFQLRSEDVSAIKDIIIEIQRTVGEYEKESKKNVEENFGIRIKFILDTIYDLKNNKKTNFHQANQQNLTKIIEKYEKVNNYEKLMINYAELSKYSENQQKWWVKGGISVGSLQASNKTETKLQKQVTDEENKLLSIAKKQGMNTDVRRNIFVAIMNSDDYLHAFENLLNLNLKGKEDREIVNVLVHCCLKEEAYNPFYGYLAAKLCAFTKNYRFTFQYHFWDRFKRVDEENLTTILNLSKLLAHLIATFSVPVTTLKVVEFVKLSPKEVLLFRTLFTRILCDNTDDVIQTLFERLISTPQLFMLRDSLLIFLKQAYRTSALQNSAIFSESEASKIRSCMKVIKNWFKNAPHDLLVD